MLDARAFESTIEVGGAVGRGGILRDGFAHMLALAFATPCFNRLACQRSRGSSRTGSLRSEPLMQGGGERNVQVGGRGFFHATIIAIDAGGRSTPTRRWRSTSR